MSALIKFKIAVLTLILQGIFFNHAIGQFTMLYRPDCGSYFGCSAHIAFADKMNGFCTEDIYLSPSSGSSIDIFKTRDGGETWESKINAGCYESGGSLLFAINSETCFAGFYCFPHNNLARLSDEGNYFYDYFTNNFVRPNDMTKLNDSVFYLVGWPGDFSGDSTNSLYRIEGDSVRVIYNVDLDSLIMFKVVFTDPDTGFVISQIVSSQEYIVRRTIDAGISWENCFSGDSLQITDIAFFNHSTGIISCSDGFLYRTDDAGATWTNIWLGTPNKINTLSLVNEDVGYCGGDTGIFYETIDRGQSWNIIPFSGNITKLHMIEQGFGYLTTLLGYSNAFYKYESQEGIENFQRDFEMNLFPNPTGGIIQLEAKNGVATALDIKLTNLFGEVIASVQNVGNNSQIDLSDYPSGIYFLRIIEGEHYYTKKIIKL